MGQGGWRQGEGPDTSPCCTEPTIGHCVCDGEGGQTRQVRLGPQGGTQEAPEGLVLAGAPAPISSSAEAPGASRPCQSVHESSSICPASRDEHGGLHIPPVSQQQTQMSPVWLGMESRAGWPCTGSTKALGLCTATQVRRPPTPHWEQGWQRPQGTSGTSPAQPHSQPSQLPLLVQLLEEGFAKLVCADHDGASRCHLNDAGQEACKDSPVSPLVTLGHL